jgi:hypothetical protein
MQLGLALLLVERSLTNLSQPMQLFDPVFTEADQTLLTSLGCSVVGAQNAVLLELENLRIGGNCELYLVLVVAALIGFDEGGARAVGSTPTFFYLPHCEAKLCDSLLAANWTPEQLGNVRTTAISFRFCICYPASYLGTFQNTYFITLKTLDEFLRALYKPLRQHMALCHNEFYILAN